MTFGWLDDATQQSAVDYRKMLLMKTQKEKQAMKDSNQEPHLLKPSMLLTELRTHCFGRTKLYNRYNQYLSNFICRTQNCLVYQAKGFVKPAFVLHRSATY